jgi:hypothetical protein
MAQAYAVRTKVLGATHPETLRTARVLEGIYRATGKVAEARALNVGQP